MEDRPLPKRGRLWSFTVQGFRPKEPYEGPEDFEPYGVGYVELEDQVIVEARLSVSDSNRLAIGIDMELEIVPFRIDGTGRERMMYVFRPTT
jgi:uncharacterized protein